MATTNNNNNNSGQLTNKVMREVAKRLLELMDSANTGIEMSLMMDGSGECGSMIYESHYSSVNYSIRSILNEYGVSIDAILERSKEWGMLEYDNGSKHVKISIGYRKYLSIPCDFSYTKWGSFHIALEMWMSYSNKSTN